MSHPFSEIPVFTVARNREMIQRAREEERQNVVAALEIEANTIGGTVGAALRAVAEQVAAGRPVGTSVVGAAERRERGASAREALDPAFNYDIEFEHLTEDQQRRRLARLDEESRAAAKKLSAQMREDDERIAREKEARRALPEIESVAQELPPDRFTSDEEDFHIAQKKLR